VRKPTSPVFFNDFSGSPEGERSRLLESIERVIDSGFYILGPEVVEFETNWANYCGTDFAVGVASGLDAIEIGLRSMGVGPGDEVITTPMTAIATIIGISRSGATPVLADIEPSTGLLDLESVKRCFSASTKVVLPVHLYGRISGMKVLSDWADSVGVGLVEDCSQAHGAKEVGVASGAWSKFGAFSFYPTKNLGAIGDAGALVTSDLALAEKARQIRNYGQTNRYVHAIEGINSRLDELQAAILTVKLASLNSMTVRRREIAESYRSGIDNPHVRLLAPAPDAENDVHHLFVVLSRNRAGLQEHLTELGIQTLIHYPIPAHMQTPYRNLARDPRGLGNAENHAQTCLSLPAGPHLEDEEVGRVIAAVNSFAV
jgi:dTDP-4-amino-4,6-dideoxygalactose transaminase